MNFKNILFVVITFTIIAGLASCKKDKKEDSPSPKPLEHPLLKIGNYWVFETVNVDEFGKEYFDRLDSTYIEKDTLIKGVVNYKQVSNSMFGTGVVTFWRDSAGVLVNHNGTTPYAYKNLGVLGPTFVSMQGTDTMFEATNTLLPGDTLVKVPAGTFRVKKLKTLFKIHFNSPFPYYRETQAWYSFEVGAEIFSTNFFMSTKDPARIETRLVRYKVK